MPNTSITASQVVTDFGAYYIDQGQNQNDIHDRLRESFGSMAAFTIIESDNTVLRAVNTAYAEVLQAFQTAYTPKGGVTFTPKAIPLYNLKTDQQFYPDALKQSWLQFLITNNTDRTTYPFVRWFIEIYLINQIHHDMEVNLYGAIAATPTAGTAGNASASFTGLKKIINDAITATTIATIATGAPSTTPETWCGQVETFCAGIPELYWENGFELNMSRSLALRYKQGRAIKYNTYYVQASDAMSVQNFENIKVAGRGSLTGKTKIWGTPKINAVIGMKGSESNMGTVEVEKVDRLVKIYTDFWFGLGFIDDGIVFTNDQDLT